VITVATLSNLLISRMRTPFWPILISKYRQRVALLYILWRGLNSPYLSHFRKPEPIKFRRKRNKKTNFSSLLIGNEIEKSENLCSVLYIYCNDKGYGQCERDAANALKRFLTDCKILSSNWSSNASKHL